MAALAAFAFASVGVAHAKPGPPNKAATTWGVWAYQPGGGTWDPCRIHYVTAPRPNARYENTRNGYVLVRVATTRADGGSFVNRFSRYHDDQPDRVVKMRACGRGASASGTQNRVTTTSPPASTGRPATTTRYGLWAYKVGTEWTPCTIHYVSAEISRYRGNAAYRLIVTSTVRGDLDRHHRSYSMFHDDQPDGRVKRKSCREHRQRLHDDVRRTNDWLACLRLAERKYPRSDLDCKGNWMTGARARHIKDAEQKLRRLDDEARAAKPRAR